MTVSFSHFPSESKKNPFAIFDCFAGSETLSLQSGQNLQSMIGFMNYSLWFGFMNYSLWTVTWIWFFLLPFLLNTFEYVAWCGFVCMSVFTSVSPSIWQSACLSVYLSVYLPYLLTPFCCHRHHSYHLLNFFSSGELKSISDVQIGEKVLTADVYGNKKFSEIIYIPHFSNREKRLFHQIYTANRDIKMTKNHLLPAGPCSIGTGSTSESFSLVFASQVKHLWQFVDKLHLIFHRSYQS